MHATPPDIAAQFAADIPQYQRDALQTIHKIMLHLAQSLTGEKPQEDVDDEHGAAQARNTTQRIRLTLQAARDLLRFRPSNSGDTQTPSADGRNGAQSTRPWRKPGRVGDDTPEAQTAQAGARASSHTDAAQAASKLLAAAGAAVSRFGEGGRINSPLAPEASSPAPTRDSSLVAHTSAFARPEHPGSLHSADLMFIHQERNKPDFCLPPRLYNYARAWQRYTAATGIESPYKINWDELTVRKPPEAEERAAEPSDLDQMLDAPALAHAERTTSHDDLPLETAEDG